MIGRFSKLGVYQELFRLRDFYLAVSAAGLALLSFIIDYGNDSTSIVGNSLAIISVTINGAPIIWGAAKGLLNREVNVDELVSLAIIASLIQGEFLTAAVVSFVMTFGGLIEQITSESARKAIKSLVRISPETATVITDDEEKTIPIDKVSVGDQILIKPGERIPVDATILSGVSAVDESAMTGEPLPIEKQVGDTILAGTLNHKGVTKAKATKVGKDTTLGKVINLVSEAEMHRPEAVRLIDRYATWFTPAILTCAAIAWIFTGDISRAVAVMIVGCPCALILAAPTATVAALGRSAKAGILVKGGQYLERVAAVKAVLFDKTGTLTLGELRVEEIACTEGIEKEEVLSCAASAEQHCTHPLARAILKAAHYAKIVVRGAENAFHEIGLGVRAMVDGSLVEVGSVAASDNTAAFPKHLQQCIDSSMSRGVTPLIVYRDQAPVGLLNVTDQVRPVAITTIKAFSKLGINEMAILSGDHNKAVQRVADSVGINKVYGRLKPQDKVDVIKEYQSRQLPVMFVGDGINDAPALAVSQVGVAMGAAGTDVALETADIALTHDNIAKLPWLIRLSRRMLTIIKVNIVFGLAFNAVAVVAGGLGWLTPIMAAIVHNVGSVLVVFASASLAIFPDNIGEKT
ncbi:MAG: cation-translocating P-type ATPase [Desulfocapsaceae bacterium]|jgi:Cd2+/Zn2+-exporting ATPase|nr:cation-translocating P-type ATPase [Desulfocapsaceae bacterium]